MYPNRQQENKLTAAALAGITAVIAIIAWLLLSVTPIPAQSCNQTTFNGTYGTIAECGR